MTIDERAFRLCMGALALLMFAWARLDGLQTRIDRPR